MLGILCGLFAVMVGALCIVIAFMIGANTKPRRIAYVSLAWAGFALVFGGLIVCYGFVGAFPLPHNIPPR